MLRITVSHLPSPAAGTRPGQLDDRPTLKASYALCGRAAPPARPGLTPPAGTQKNNNHNILNKAAPLAEVDGSK